MALGGAEVLPAACIADLTAMSVDINRPSAWACLVHNTLVQVLERPKELPKVYLKKLSPSLVHSGNPDKPGIF